MLQSQRMDDCFGQHALIFFRFLRYYEHEICNYLVVNFEPSPLLNKIITLV